MRFAFLCVLLVGLFPAAHAQAPTDSVAAILAPAPNEDANHADDPDRIPYETETDLGERVLAFPSTLWSGVRYVLRSAILYAEYSGGIERVQELLKESPPVYVLPTFSAGGREGLSGGLTVYLNDQFLAPGQRARIGGRYGENSTYAAFARFTDDLVLGTRLGVRLSGGYYSDGFERFYDIGNDTPRDALIPYAFREARAETGFSFPITPRIRLSTDAQYRRYDTFESDIDEDDEDEDFLAFDPATPGLGVADLLEGGVELVLDFSEAGGLRAPRVYQGTELLFGLRYGRDVTGRPLSYQRYSVELRQFVPLPFLPFDRRLGLRARLENTQAPGADRVPFYELSTLGGPNTLRGYAFDRFRDRGSLLLTAEYRYPIFDVLDAVLFADAGQVFHAVDDLALDRFHTDVGGGFRVYGGDTVAARLELAVSPEGPRLIAQIGASF